MLPTGDQPLQRRGHKKKDALSFMYKPPPGFDAGLGLKRTCEEGNGRNLGGEKVKGSNGRRGEVVEPEATALELLSGKRKRGRQALTENEITRRFPILKNAPMASDLRNAVIAARQVKSEHSVNDTFHDNKNPGSWHSHSQKYDDNDNERRGAKALAKAGYFEKSSFPTSLSWKNISNYPLIPLLQCSHKPALIFSI